MSLRQCAVKMNGREVSEHNDFDEDEWLSQEAPSFAYPSREELIRLAFASPLEALRLLDEKIAEWQDVISAASELIKEDLRAIREIKDEWSRWFNIEALKITPAAKQIREALAQIKRLKGLKATARRVFGIEDEAKRTSRWEDKVARAREARILDVVSALIEVRKRGKSHVALCPFHEDRNPSFHVYPETNSWHCFGCQKGGDAIEFVRLYLKYDFRQAIKYLTGGEEDDRQGVREGIRKNRRRCRS